MSSTVLDGSILYLNQYNIVSAIRFIVCQTDKAGLNLIELGLRERDKRE